MAEFKEELACNELDPITIVLDVEFKSSNMITGDCLQLGFVAIRNGVNLLNIDCKEEWFIDSLSVCFKTQMQDEERSVMDFWSNFPDVYKRIESEAGPISEKMKEAQDWLNALSEKYKIVDFVADISCIDFPWFRNLYLTYCDRSKNKFTLPYKAICQYSMEQSLIMAGFAKDEIKVWYQSDMYPHTHYAEEDALKTAYEYLRLRLFIIMNVRRR